MTLEFFSPLSNIAPFTYRDGETYLERLSRLQRWCIETSETLTDQINQVINMFDAGMATATKDASDAKTLATEADSNSQNMTVIQDAGANALLGVANGLFVSNLNSRYAKTINVLPPTGVAATDTANAAAAITKAITAGNGIVEFDAGTYEINATLPVISKTGIIIRGRGSDATTLHFTGTGRCLDYQPSNFNVKQGGLIEGLTLDATGNINANTVGIHFGDIVGMELHDIVVQHFKMNSSIGILMDTPTKWTERQLMVKVHVDDCTNCFVWDGTSHGWSRYLDVRANINAQDPTGYAQTAFLVKNSAHPYNSTINATVNVAGTDATRTLAPTVFHVADTSTFGPVNGSFYAELTSGQTGSAPGLVVDNGAHIWFDGVFVIPWNQNPPTNGDVSLVGWVEVPGMTPVSGMQRSGHSIVTQPGKATQDITMRRTNAPDGVNWIISQRQDNDSILWYSNNTITGTRNWINLHHLGGLMDFQSQVRFKSAYVPFYVTVAPDGNGVATIDPNTGNHFAITLNGANVSATNITAANGTIQGGAELTITYIQDAVGGHTYAWPTDCRFAGHAAPSNTTPNSRTSVTFVRVGTLWFEKNRAESVG